MALVDLTKQLAQQAILSATSEKPAAPPQPESAGAVILAQLGAMQKALKEDEELLVLFQNIRIFEIFLPSRQVAILTGMDPERRQTRVISPVDTLQLVCKTIKPQPGVKPLRIK